MGDAELQAIRNARLAQLRQQEGQSGGSGELLTFPGKKKRKQINPRAPPRMHTLLTPLSCSRFSHWAACVLNFPLTQLIPLLWVDREEQQVLAKKNSVQLKTK